MYLNVWRCLLVMIDKVLAEIKPSKAERNEIKNEVGIILKSLKSTDIRPVVGGSIAKDTWLKGTHDIDIFVKFDNYN